MTKKVKVVREAEPADVRVSPAPENPGIVQNQPPHAPTVKGRIETLSTEFVIGWASVSATGRFAHVFAMVEDEVVGFGVADIVRPDLERLRQAGEFNAYSFIVVFDKPVAADLVQSIKVFIVGQQAMLRAGRQK